MADIYHKRDWTWGIIEGNTGTFGSGDFDDTTLTSTSSTQIVVDDTIEISKNINKRRPNRANGYRQNWHLDATQDDYGVSPTLAWSGDVTKEGVDRLLAGLFQRCDEGETPVFPKIFKWPTASAVWSATTFGYPTFKDDEGYFFGFVENSPVASLDTGILSCVPTEATFMIDSSEQGNRLKFTSNWIGRITHEGVVLTTPTAYTAPTYFVFDDMTVTIGGTSVICYGWSFTVNPGFKQIPAGNAGCQDISMGPHKVTGYIDVLWDVTTRTVYADIDDDSSGYQTAPIAIYWGAGNDPVTADGELRIELNAQFDSVANQGTEERIRRLNFECVKDATYEDIEIQIGNSLDRTWQT